MDIINLDDLRARIHEVGLGHHAEALLGVTAPAIRLTTHEVKEDTPLGSTKLGGLPDLPPGVAWPVVDGVLLEFVGQFRLADLTPYDAEGRLPQSGMLYFFFDGMLTGYDRGEGKDRRAVLYYDGPLDTLERRQEPAHHYDYLFSVYNACALDYETVWTLPPLEEIGDHEAFVPPVTPILTVIKEWATYRELRKPLRDFSHRLLGHPDEVQGGEMRLQVALARDLAGRFAYRDYNYQNRDELIAEMRRWRLLAQFTSDQLTDMSWGCGGLIYFWIREEDLAARRFDRVYGELVST
ncbi:MAG: DUF1963 domain-containing protein [Anaerolineae bacterium]|nr:DUF1963 domain-containing protein [Anaerolineae bacterium]